MKNYKKRILLVTLILVSMSSYAAIKIPGWGFGCSGTTGIWVELDGLSWFEVENHPSCVSK